MAKAGAVAKIIYKGGAEAENKSFRLHKTATKLRKGLESKGKVIFFSIITYVWLVLDVKARDFD